MTFLIDADFPDRTKIIESSNWKIYPTFDETNAFVTGYYLQINKERFPITKNFYRKVLAEMLGNYYISGMIICRNGNCKVLRGQYKPN